MKNAFIRFENFDYGFQPGTYFTESGSPLHYNLSKVTGTARRRVIQAAFEKVEAVPEALLDGVLSVTARNKLSALHPSLMGGEYQPEIEDSEVEIARLELKSTTADVISIRASWENGYYHYSVVDEYESDFFDVPVKRSARPFTFRKLIGFLNGISIRDDDFPVGIVTMHAERHISCGCSYKDMLSFQAVHSEIYLELNRYYRLYVPLYLKGLGS